MNNLKFNGDENMAIPAVAAAGGAAAGSTAGGAATSSGLSQAGATVAGAAIQGGSSLVGDLFGAFIIRAVQARRAQENASAWNERLLQREDQQNRFSNLMTMRQSDQYQQRLDESKKKNNASLYQSQFNQMLSTINNNANLKNMVLQRWGGL